MTATFADYVAQQDARNTIELNVRKWSLMLCDALLDNFKSRNNSSSDYKFYIESGRKYHKIIMDANGSRSVHAFVDRKTGEVYKSASWKSPALGQPEVSEFSHPNPPRAVLVIPRGARII